MFLRLTYNRAHFVNGKSRKKKKKTTARTNVMFQGTTDILKLEISLDSVLNFMLHRTV